MAKRTLRDLKGFPGMSNMTEGMMAGGGKGGGGRKLKWGKIISNLFKGKKMDSKGSKLGGEKIKEVQTKPSKVLGDQKVKKIKRRKKEEISIQERGKMRKKQEQMKAEGRKNKRRKNKAYGDWNIGE